MSNDREIRLSAEQFTEVLVENLITCMLTIPSHHAGGIHTDSLTPILQSRIGVARRSTEVLLVCLTTLGLVSEVDGVVGRSPRGDRLRREIRDHGGHAVVPMIIRSGVMADQIRALRAILARDDHGYSCGRAAARTVAPQLVGLVCRMPDVTDRGRLTIGSATGLELDSVWNELTPDARVNWEDVEKRRKAIGDRAELYSLQLERSSHLGAIEHILWVSRDDDSLGYDIEVAASPTRRIEVKGSSGRDVQFFLSANEYRVAQHHGAAYEIHFWGEIDLRRGPRDDYERLRAAGYPICIVDPVAALAVAPWTIAPSQYRVGRPRT